ncbi:sulfotransferase [Frigidibacter sp. SD6-1]|uniref:sulfotransferase n=1 Tax=Frigidibacter sp. SD6-1 TaxID=3032581 RepID=UPI0024E029AE|nr:sulfotransferase [Frigidibacter sp. SD6-1]
MLFWGLVTLAAVLASEALLRLPVIGRIAEVSATAQKAGRVLKSGRISDHWKERILPAYALRIGVGSVTFFLLLCLALLPVALLGLLYPPGLSAWMAALLRPMAILVLCVVSLGYLWLRTRGAAAHRAAGASSDYSALDRTLHRLALGSPMVGEMAMDIEKGLFLKSAPQDDGRHVFVTGLARAGTTILMREIHATGQFGSLTYADMPFVLAPNLWAKLSSKGAKPGARTERAHGDGIEVDTQSPEALDEVYWKMADGGAYIGADGLSPHSPDGDVVAGYRDLIRLVLRKTGKGRYVSKNNNNILRIATLAEAIPEAQILVPLREPLAHAASLLNQHERFADSDPFVCDYMTWLGHHEFGATHRPFLFDGRPEGDPATLDYWLRVWIAAYRALDTAEAAHENIAFVPYEALSADPAVWQAVARRIGLEPRPAGELKVARDKAPGAHDAALAAEAAALHARLKARGLARLGL